MLYLQSKINAYWTLNFQNCKEGWNVPDGILSEHQVITFMFIRTNLELSFRLENTDPRKFQKVQKLKF